MYDTKITLHDSEFNGIAQSWVARFVLFAVLCVTCAISSAAEKPRVFVLTDIENEPDDAMSMVRFLTYTNHYDI